MEPAIACRGLTKRFGPVAAVDALDLEIAPGNVVGFLGANGAGKSTTLRMLVGLLRPTEGTVTIAGVPAEQPEARRAVGYMPADPAFYGALTGRENLDLLASFRGGTAPARAHAAELLALAPRDLDRPVREYSSGMVQKLALIQAVQHEPGVVILDEPANRLDPLAHRRFEELVREIADSGRAVFLSSHTLGEVEDVCDSVAMIRAGRLLAHRAVAELADLSMRHVRAVFRAPPEEVPAGLLDPRVEGRTLTGRVARADLAPLRALLARTDLVDVVVEPATLEEVFIELYGEER